MENFSERLKRLRERAGYKVTDVVDALDLQNGTYRAYEEGRADPKSKTLIKIAALYGCTVDYLLGRSDEAPADSEMIIAKINTAPVGIRESVYKLLDLYR